jgi:hypothetical protein
MSKPMTDEQIKVGKYFLGVTPAGFRIVRAGIPVVGEMVVMGNGRAEVNGADVAEDSGIYIIVEPIPRPLSKDDVLRECAKFIRSGLIFVYDKEEEMLQKIDAVLKENSDD